MDLLSGDEGSILISKILVKTVLLLIKPNSLLSPLPNSHCPQEMADAGTAPRWLTVGTCLDNSAGDKYEQVRVAPMWAMM